MAADVSGGVGRDVEAEGTADGRREVESGAEREEVT